MAKRASACAGADSPRVSANNSSGSGLGSPAVPGLVNAPSARSITRPPKTSPFMIPLLAASPAAPKPSSNLSYARSTQEPLDPDSVEPRPNGSIRLTGFPSAYANQLSPPLQRAGSALMNRQMNGL